MNLPAQPIDVQPIVDWLVDGVPPDRDPARWMRAFCERLVACGVRIDRMAVFVRPLHPNVAARAFYWRAGSDTIEMNEEAHAFLASDEQLASPIRLVLETRTPMRRRLRDATADVDYPILSELRAQGFTDYVLAPIEFIGGEVHALSVATRAPGGFSDAELTALARVRPALTRIIEVQGLARKAANILDAYLGRHAGERVLQGRIRRGDAEQLHAILWFCDLRDSTMLAESMSPNAYLSMLNDYFDSVLAPLQASGGEVLSFIGDAALAIFPIAADAGDAATRAVDASTEALEGMSALNARREAAGEIRLRFGIALHIGEVLYGNVGTPTRIQFTVVGAAANEVARIEGLCKTLDVALLASEEVARRTAHRWRAMGTHRLRGVGKPAELFTLGDVSAQ